MEINKQVGVQNIVASGKLDLELDLASVLSDLQDQTGIADVKHSRESGNRLLIYFTDNDALAILSPNGVYIINGVNNIEEIEDSKQKLLYSLAELGIISSSEPKQNQVSKPFQIRNIVCTADLDQKLNLSELSIGFGIEVTEYEPEQFPGLVYNPDGFEGTVLLFSSGKIVITGVDKREKAKKILKLINEKIKNIYN